jgi:hypothetical protein
MWTIDNQTAYAADGNWVRDSRGRHHWIVAVRATFDFFTGRGFVLSDEQQPPALAPEYSGVAGASSLRWDSDLLYIKPCTDVVLEAEAYASGGRRVVEARLQVGSIDKRLIVYGPRFYQEGPFGPTLSSPEAFERQPIRYESAFGGTDLTDPDPVRQRLDERNPVGRGVAARASRLLGSLGPAIEYPERSLERGGPAGFGPIDPSWRPRRDYAGTFDAAWAANKKPLLPDDYDDLYGSAAPSDQRPSQHLRGGESVELTGMTDDGVWRFTLPKRHPTFRTRFGTEHEEHRGKLVTVFIQPSQRRLSLVWQSSILVSTPRLDYLDETRVGEKLYVQ